MPASPDWYMRMAGRAAIGRIIRRKSILWWRHEPPIPQPGNSINPMSSPTRRFVSCKNGMGLTAASRVVVVKSNKIFGWKNPETAAQHWTDASLAAVASQY